MITWKNSGETRANNWRKKEATSTSVRTLRYLWMAPRNQVTSKRRVRSTRPARRVIRTRSPVQPASSSACVITAGRDLSGSCPKTLSLLTLARRRKPPSRMTAMPGKAVPASRCDSDFTARARRPSSLAQRSISGTPIRGPKRWRIWAGSAPTPWKRRSMTKAVTPGSVCCDCGCETKTGMLKVRSAPGTDCGNQSKRFHGSCSPPSRIRDEHAPVGWWLPNLLSSAVREPASAASSLKYRRADGTRYSTVRSRRGEPVVWRGGRCRRVYSGRAHAGIFRPEACHRLPESLNVHVVPADDVERVAVARHRGNGAEQAERLSLHARGEEDLTFRSRRTAIARGQRPEIADGDRLAIHAVQRADEFVVLQVERVDRAVAEIAHQQVAGKLAKIGRRDGHSPRRVERAVGRDARD